MKVFLIFVVLALVAKESHQKKDYSNYKIIKSDTDLTSLLDDAFIPYQVVNEDGSAIMLHPPSVNKAFSLLRANNVAFSVVTHDLQKDIEDESVASKDWFLSYHKLDQIMEWFEQKASSNEGTQFFEIGKSYEKRPLKVFKMIGKKTSCKQKPTIWVDSGIHSREWISHTTGSYIVEKLLDDYGKDPAVTSIRDDYDLYFLPVMNPDGYVYTWEKDRLWRKSRKPVDFSMCVGTDTNRNFDHQWGTIGISHNPCEQTYAGPKAFSDPEAKTVADFILSKNGTWDVFATLHSYGHLMLAPWGYTHDLPSNYADLEKVGNATVKAISEKHGVKYRFGTSANILYQSSGTSRDWAKGVAKIPYVYTFELRNDNSFILPPKEILPTAEEIYAGFLAMLKSIRSITPPVCKQ